MDTAGYIINHYTPGGEKLRDEHARLTSRPGQVEFLTTLHYIEKYLCEGMNILEIGAASGRYSHTLARRGCRVDAVELVPHNIEVFKANTEPGEQVAIYEGNATDLSRFANDQYDITLLLGPMYHLFEAEDKHRALSEALRVTKPGGVLFVAYCCPDASIVQYGFMRGGLEKLFASELLDPVTFKAVSRPEEIFELHRKEEIDALMQNFPELERLHYVASDLIAHYITPALAQWTDEQFDLFMRYHLTLCERPDMAGLTNHALDILRKTNRKESRR